MSLRKVGFRIAGLGVVLGLAAMPARAGIVEDVRVLVGQNSYAAAEGELRDYKSQHGITPEYVEAWSWVARGAAAMKQWSQAANYGLQTRKLAEQLLAKQKLDSEPHLPIALGAAYEVQSQALAETGKRAEASALLRAALAKYSNTSIQARLQKNLNLISLVGRPAPPLQAAQYLGVKPPTLASLKGKPVLLFFWAHWCADCKAEVAIVARLRAEFSSSGLAVIGPTKYYGYAAQGNDATPEQERAYIDSVRQRFYGSLADMPVPVSKQNFDAYGASTTPTIVILNRAGQVATYHPGAMMYEDLRAELEKASR